MSDTKTLEEPTSAIEKNKINNFDVVSAFVAVAVSVVLCFLSAKLLSYSAKGISLRSFHFGNNIIDVLVFLAVLGAFLYGIFLFSKYCPFLDYNKNHTPSKKLLYFGISSAGLFVLGLFFYVLINSAILEKEARIDFFHEQGYSNINRGGKSSYNGTKDGKEYVIVYDQYAEGDDRIAEVYEKQSLSHENN